MEPTFIHSLAHLTCAALWLSLITLNDGLNITIFGGL
jgi:hypothetical protein